MMGSTEPPAAGSAVSAAAPLVALQPRAYALLKTMIAVITCDGAMLGLYTSQVDAWKVAKHIIGASMWRCAPNSDVCEVIDWK